MRNVSLPTIALVLLASPLPSSPSEAGHRPLSQEAAGAPALYSLPTGELDMGGGMGRGRSIITAFASPVSAASLIQKWEGMKAALRRGDIPAALEFVHSESRPRYEEVFRSMTPDQLANIGQFLTTIRPVEIGHNGAEFHMLRQEGGDVLSFPVWFPADEDGIWRLRRF